MPKVLIADDNSNIQKMAALALKDQGFEVVGVSNGEAAVKKLADLMPDVVLADVFMPVRNGYEVCEFVKNDPRFAHMPVVLLVGAFDPVDEHEVKRVGADDVLQKPFVPPDPLIAMVRQMAEKSAAARPAAAAAPKVDSTIKLSKEELAALTGAPPPPPPEPEPEIHDYAVRAEPVKMGETDQPMVFGDLLGAPAEVEAKKAPEPEGFVASSIEHVEVPAEEQPEAAAAEPEVPNWGGIESPPREPSPDEPPIKVEFGEPEPMELVTDEDQSASQPSIEIAAPSELASSPDDFMAAAPPPATAPPLEPEPPPIDLLAHEEASVPAPAPVEDDISLMDTQEVRDFTPPVPPAAVIPPAPEPPPPPPIMAAAAPVGPQPLDPAVVEAAVDKVLSRIQPELMEKITREVLRPVVEQLLRKELEK